MKDKQTIESLTNQAYGMALSKLRGHVLREQNPSISLANGAISLRKAGLSKKDPEIEHANQILDRWFESNIEKHISNELLDESSTALLGLWIYIHSKRSDSVDDLFLASITHNLAKSKPLSLANDIDMLSSCAKGLSKLRREEAVRKAVLQQLAYLSNKLVGIELLQALEAAKEIMVTGEFPALEIRHRFEEIKENSSSLYEQTVSVFGLLLLDDEVANISSNLQHELEFASALATLLSAKSESIDEIKAYSIFVPYLAKKYSKENLLSAWSSYTSKEYKKAKTENYISRSVFVFLIMLAVGYYLLPLIRVLKPEIQASIGVGFATVLLTLFILTIELVANVNSINTWKNGSVEKTIALIGAIITLVFFLMGALSK